MLKIFSLKHRLLHLYSKVNCLWNCHLKAGLMSTFVSHVNPVTGKMDWIWQDENYDYHQEIARSAYADMLHDTERNQKYYSALRKAIRYVHAQGRKAHVLDIGTGTGLLSMMAVTAGADTVTACEAFHPMAKCAEKIMERNKCGGKIKMILKRSTEITLGPDGDMSRKANILVTEVFDTELIGEGAIRTFNHAHQELLEADCIVIPRAANMYAQPVSSNLVRRWNEIDLSEIGADVACGAVGGCGGAPALHDLQLDQLHTKHFVQLSRPQLVFRFDFASNKGLPQNRKCEKLIEAESDGHIDAVFMWWDCEMDFQGEITLSCAPGWAHPEGTDLPWRDHWMQAIYYPSTVLSITQGSSFTLLSCHDEYSLWFDVHKDRKSLDMSERPVCTCGFHNTLSRTRIGMMGDPQRISILNTVLKQNVNESTVCLCISDGSLLSIMAARLGAQVFVVETNPMYRRITESLIKENHLSNRITILDKSTHDVALSDLDNKQIDFVIGEPYFSSSLLPWHNIYFWYAVRDLAHLLTDNAILLPATMVMKAVAMEFDHLWKIRAPVGVCEGFDLAEFDKLVESSTDVSDVNVEPQPLWEYPGRALSDTTEVLRIQYINMKEIIHTTTYLHIEMTGRLNGVALWTEYEFGVGNTLSSGPVEEVRVGERVEWDLYTRQGVHLLQTPRSVLRGDNISLNIRFKPISGDFDFTFNT